MTTLVNVEGSFEPIRLEDDFRTTANGLNNAGHQGMTFVLTRTEDGKPIGINLMKINTFTEVDDD